MACFHSPAANLSDWSSFLTLFPSLRRVDDREPWRSKRAVNGRIVKSAIEDADRSAVVRTRNALAVLKRE